MVFKTGLFQSNKQIAINKYFIKNLKKGEKKILNSSCLQYSDIGLENYAALVV